MCNCTRHPDPQSVWPVRLTAGAFGPGRPCRDLLLSPNHAVYVTGDLIPIKFLINDTTIVQVPVDEITYYHVKLARHDILLAEALAVESYLDAGDRSNFDNSDEPMRLYPDFGSVPCQHCGFLGNPGLRPTGHLRPQVCSRPLLAERCGAGRGGSRKAATQARCLARWGARMTDCDWRVTCACWVRRCRGSCRGADAIGRRSRPTTRCHRRRIRSRKHELSEMGSFIQGT